MDTGIKVVHDNKHLNPEQQVYCEELLNCLLHLLSIGATAGALDKVFCPELTGIFQSFSNVFLPATRKITNTAEAGIIVQATDVPL